MATARCRFVDVAAGFTLADLLAIEADLVWFNNPAGKPVTYSPGELSAIQDFARGGHGGVVASFLLSYMGADNSELADLVGIDPATLIALSTPTAGQPLDVYDPLHPLMRDLPTPLAAATYREAQAAAVPWASALLPGAEIVAESADGLDVVLGYEGAGWNGVYFSTYAEYQVFDPDRLQLLYNAAYWAAGYGG